MKHNLGLELVMPAGINVKDAYDSTDRNTCIDWCMTSNERSHQHKITVYESWFSDHKPLWLEIKQF